MTFEDESFDAEKGKKWKVFLQFFQSNISICFENKHSPIEDFVLVGRSWAIRANMLLDTVFALITPDSH